MAKMGKSGTSAAKPRKTKASTTPKRTASAKGKGPSLALLSAGAAALGIGGALIALFARGRAGSGEHVPTDLLGEDRPAPTDRAPVAFRPDPTAPVPAGERDSLRPATGPLPTLVRH
jgi:hypothetical protein